MSNTWDTWCVSSVAKAFNRTNELTSQRVRMLFP